MKVTPEALAVLPDPERREVNLIMAGLRVTLGRSEASFLADGVYRALGQLREPPPKLSSFDRAAAAAGHVRPV